MDSIDRHIIDSLSEDGRMSWRELGDRVGLSAPAAAERVHALERDGVIIGYRAIVNPAALDLGIEAVIRIKARGSTEVEEIAERLAEVTELRRVTGTDSHVLRTAVRSTAHLEELLQEFWAVDADTITNIITSTPVPPRPLPVRRLVD